MRILAIETSCDETAAAVIADGRTICSNVVATQIELHRRFGGVFPEVASRQHVLAIYPVIREALEKAGHTGSAGIDLAGIDAVAVTHGPGLAGSLLVGVNASKGLALASGLPLIPVNHLEGHIYSNWLIPEGTASASGDAEAHDAFAGAPFPVIVLIVSGGHTELILMTGHGDYTRLGATLDDAAGEAFDKVARLLGLGFPGGPAIQRAAESGDAEAFALPRPLLSHGAQHRYNFSFSGLKTAVLNTVRDLQRGGTQSRANPGHAQAVASTGAVAAEDMPAAWTCDLAASFQAAVAEVLVEKLLDAAQAYGARHVCICGGVSANRALRELAAARLQACGIPLTIPPLALCTDNAAMIGAAAYYRLQHDPHAVSDLRLDVYASLPLGAGKPMS